MSRRLSASAVPVKAAAPEQKDQHNDYEDRIHDFFPSFLRYTKARAVPLTQPYRTDGTCRRRGHRRCGRDSADCEAGTFQPISNEGVRSPGPSHVRAARLAPAMNDKHSFLPV